MGRMAEHYEEVRAEIEDADCAAWQQQMEYEQQQMENDPAFREWHKQMDKLDQEHNDGPISQG